MAKHYFPIGSLVRIAAAILTLLSVPSVRAQSAKDNPLKIYDRVYIHPKEPVQSVSSSDQEDLMEVTHQDGTVEKIFANVWDADLNRAMAAWVAFGDRPSQQTFAALDDIQKRKAVKAVLFSSNMQEDEGYGDERRKLSEAYMAALPKGDQDRILFQAFNESLEILGGDPSESDNTKGIFQKLTRGQNQKMREVICPLLYSPEHEFDKMLSQVLVRFLDKVPETKIAMALTCPTKDKGSFKIGDQIAKVREGIYVDPDAEKESDAEVVPPPQLKILSAVKCSKEDFIAQLNEVDVEFKNIPGPHTSWFRRSVGECRFQGSVKKSRTENLNFNCRQLCRAKRKSHLFRLKILMN